MKYTVFTSPEITERPITMMVVDSDGRGSMVMRMNKESAEQLARELLTAAYKSEHPDTPPPHVFMVEA